MFLASTKIVYFFFKTFYYFIKSCLFQNNRINKGVICCRYPDKGLCALKQLILDRILVLHDRIHYSLLSRSPGLGPSSSVMEYGEYELGFSKCGVTFAEENKMG